MTKWRGSEGILSLVSFVKFNNLLSRAHLNDLENISVFYVIGFIYTLTNPSVAWATLLFRVFTAARFIHTFVYAVFVVPQPARALSWATGFVITGYMAFKSIMHFL
jgi:glutathione S-transferase